MTTQYTTPGTLKTSVIEQPQIRLLLVGPPKSGKTFSAASFPAPTFIDFDSGLTSKELRDKNLDFLPFYDEAFIKDKLKQQNRPNALTWFLTTEAPKFGPGQTLVFDSASTIADAVSDSLWKQAPLGKDGNKDGFWYWKQWATWWRGFAGQLLTLKCHVVLTAHEQEIRDGETGRVLSYKWMLPGQEFSPRLGQFFSDVVRQVKTSTVSTDGKASANYQWQVVGDNLFPFACSRMKTDTKFVKADYSSFLY